MRDESDLLGEAATYLGARPEKDATDRRKEDANDEEQRQHALGGQDRSKRKASVSANWLGG